LKVRREKAALSVYFCQPKIMSKEFILIVDDEPGVTMLCERLLQREGYLTESFTNPHAAVEFLSKRAFDLLLVDVRMPEVDGFQVIEHAQQIQPDAAILIMTGHGTVETAIKALRKGVDGLILKPFSQGIELVEAVRQALLDSQTKKDASRTKALQPLFSITEDLLSETHRDVLLDRVMSAISENLLYKEAFYLQEQSSDGKVRITSCRGELLTEVFTIQSMELISRVNGTAKGFLVNINGPGDPDLKQLMSKSGIGSIMYVPLKRVSGKSVLIAAKFSGEAPFRESDLELFQIFCRQAAVAMENADLYEEQRENLRKMKESQKALVQAEKMATAGRLTASIAHEVNNPLQAMQNCLHLASRTDIPEAKQKEYLGMANSELERLMLTVQRMLDYYRPSGALFEKVNIGEALQYVLDLMSKQMSESGITWAINMPADLPDVLAIRNQIQQVFINLILNASDAMINGGKLSISGKALANGVEILFKDTGPGVPSESQLKIFDPFFSTKDGGSGLGLTVSSNITTAHGGTLELVPSQGTGALFRLFLPSGGKK